MSSGDKLKQLSSDEERRASQARVANLEEEGWIKFFYYFLVMAQFVPVSLYVSMSMTKNFQGRFLEWDLGVYHAETDTCVCGVLGGRP